MDEKKLLNRIQYLSYSLFINNAEGVEFIKLMKLLHLNTQTFPQSPDVLERHGGAIGWAAFREGQLTLVRNIQELAQNYLDKIEFENNKEQHK